MIGNRIGTLITPLIIPFIIVALIVIFLVNIESPESIKKTKLLKNPFVVFLICAIVAAYFAVILMSSHDLGTREIATVFVTLFGLGAIVLPIIITLRENKKRENKK